MASQPTDLDGLRKLYFTEFVPLYDYLCSKLENLPSELHFEVTAAFDHVMRAGLEYDGRKFESENYAKASGHLKRATVDCRGFGFHCNNDSRALCHGVVGDI